MRLSATGRPPGRPSLTGISIGALICAVFGSSWMFWGAAWSGSHPPMWYFYALDVISLPLIGIAILGVRRAFRVASSQPRDMPSWRSLRGRYWIITGTEWASAVATAIWLSRIGRSDLIPQVCGVIVGLHFFPLARIFRAPIYNGTGAAMIVGALVSLMLSRGYGRNILGCGAVGLTLWVTAVVLLARLFSASPSPATPLSNPVS
jgi:hypothetical protein